MTDAAPSSAATALRLAPERLRRHCDPGVFAFASTAEVEPLGDTIGQARALEAIRFGLEIGTRGYNIFATGPAGTGRRTTLRTYLERYAAERPTPGDWVYLFDFENEQRPLAVPLPAGQANQLAREMSRLIEDARRDIPRAFESENYQRSQRSVMEDLDRQREAHLGELREYARGRGIGLEMTPTGVMTVLLIDGRPATREQFEAFPETQRDELRGRFKEIEQRLAEATNRLRIIEREGRERMRQLDREIALFAVGHLVDETKAHYEQPAVQRWLDQVREDILENIAMFRPPDGEGSEPPLLEALVGAQRRSREEFFGRYAVNVLVSRDEQNGAPVVIETNPTYYNLFGRLEYRATLGAVTTDHRYIRPGAIHRANGGYLMLEALDVLAQPFTWDRLKQVLRTGQVQIENIGAQYTLFPTTTLTPEPVPLDLKVVLIGPTNLYQLLYALDEEVRELFRVRADFDIELPWGDEQVRQYAAFISRQVREQGLRHFDPGAVARVVEHSARIREHQQKLSARFIDIVDLLAEASHWAARAGRELVSAEDVERAIEAKIYRSNLVEEKIRELIADATLLVDTEGAKAGQVNGLAVAALGDYEFGRPTRITAAIAVGEGDVVNIDRETKMSGPLHDKGFLILGGFLRDRFGRERPLSLRASMVFEQSYEEIEGDSASSAELYALLSALADAPIEQGIAVTGSVDQRGEVQAIGGVNEKIEGFFAVCRARGLTGRQGVVIPAANVRNLMLRKEVVEAVREGRFSIWAVEAIDQGLEILTGIPSGERGPDGAYPAGSLYARVDERLARMAEIAREFGGARDGGNGEPADGDEAEEPEPAAPHG